jgi:hypothetical protein
MSEMKTKISIFIFAGLDCSRRWAYVRDYYIRRRGKPGAGSGGEAVQKRANVLSFLDSMPVQQRKTSTKVDPLSLTMNFVRCDIEETPQINTEEILPKIEETEEMAGISRTNVSKIKKRKKMSHPEGRLELLKSVAQRESAPIHEELDETDLFFSSMARIVKKLPRIEQAQLRMQISSLISNAEIKSLSKEPPNQDDEYCDSDASLSDI